MLCMKCTVRKPPVQSFGVKNTFISTLLKMKLPQFQQNFWNILIYQYYSHLLIITLTPHLSFKTGEG